MSDPLQKLDEIQFNADNLWREEMYTDREVGSIRVMIPVTSEGLEDPMREKEFYVQTQVMTGAGALPVEGRIEAKTMAEAVANYGPSAKQAVEDMIKRVQEMQREAANQIVTPDQAFGGGGMGGMGGGMGGMGGPGGPVSLR